MNSKFACSILALMFSAASLCAQPGSLDSTFNGVGWAAYTFNGFGDYAYRAVLQPDGKIVACGGTATATDGDIAVMRLNSDGTPDNSFSLDGKATFSLGMLAEEAYGIAIQPNGKILLTGYVRDTFGQSLFVLRLMGDGNLDTTFASNGVWLFTNGSNNFGSSLLLPPGGEIYVGAQFSDSLGYDMVVFNLDQNGSLDSTFGWNGMSRIDFGDYEDTYSSLLQPDGKIVIAGETNVNGTSDFAIARLDSMGALDPDFGTLGQVITPVLPNDYDGIFSIALQQDGKIVAGGYADNGTTYEMAFARYETDGSLDVNFGAGGYTVFPIAGGETQAVSLAVQADGKIIAAGFFDNNFSPTFKLVRLNSDGSLDSGFDGDGVVNHDLTGQGSFTQGVLIQPDGKYLAYGFASVSGFDIGFAFARYHGGDLVSAESPDAMQNSLVAYPVPATNELNVKFYLRSPASVGLKIVDLMGREILSFENEHPWDAGNQTVKLALPDEMPAGLYSLVFSVENHNESIFFLKE